MIHESNIPGNGIVRNTLSRADAADAPAIHLDKTHLSIVDEVSCHMKVVCPFSAREFDAAAAAKR
jgi:hypothetical protein